MRRMQGFAIVAGLFILVVLAALGAFILNVSTNQQIGSLLDVQGAQAYQAARAGAEWGLYQQMQKGSCTSAVTSFVPAATTLSKYTVTVTCTSTTDASGGPTSYVVQSTACNQPNAAEPKCPNTSTANTYYVERRVTVAF